MENNQSNKTIKFSVYSYRQLLANQLKLANELDKLHLEQNKTVMDKLVTEGLVDNKYTPIGIIENPKSEQDFNELTKVLSNFALKYTEYNGKPYVELDKDLFDKLSISVEDIASCVIPENNEA